MPTSRPNSRPSGNVVPTPYAHNFLITANDKVQFYKTEKFEIKKEKNVRAGAVSVHVYLSVLISIFFHAYMDFQQTIKIIDF